LVLVVTVCNFSTKLRPPDFLDKEILDNYNKLIGEAYMCLKTLTLEGVSWPESMSGVLGL